jgi:hypothetical protein
MATPKYDALVAKVRDWSNKPEQNTIEDSVIQDCLKYSADECYRKLRIPPLEYTTRYTVDQTDNIQENGLTIEGTGSYTSFMIPEDLIQFNYIRTVAQNNLETPYSNHPNNVSKVFHEITDKRTFFDIYSEKYSRYNWMWQDGRIFIHPQLPVGTIIEINYYRRLSALNASYTVLPVNYLISFTDAQQPYLELVVSGGTNLYFSTSAGVTKCFATSAEAASYNPTVTTKMYTGREVSNWLRDENERLLVWGALYNLGAYLFDDKMEQRYLGKFQDNIDSLNKEEKWRRSLGGNVQINFNTNGLI